MSDEILTDGDEGAIDGGAFEVKRGPGRPKKVAEPIAAPDPVPSGSGPGAMPGVPSSDTVQLMLMQTIERLCDKLDADPRDNLTLDALQAILAQNAGVLKETFRKEEPRHPDVSFYNPLGERDHPRPRLRRPVRFLGIPYEYQDELTLEELTLLNSFESSMETADHRWRASVIRTMNGGEELFISVPFNNFDDLRGVQLIPVLKAILAGKTSHHGQTADDQVAGLRAELAELREWVLAKKAEQPAAAVA